PAPVVAKGKLPEIVRGETVPLIETGQAALSRQVEGILCDVLGARKCGASGALRDQGLATSEGRVSVQRFRKRIAAANRNPGLQPFAEPHRQCIGSRISYRVFPVERLHA